MAMGEGLGQKVHLGVGGVARGGKVVGSERR